METLEILSTKILPASLIKEAGKNHIHIVSVEMIKIVPIQTPELKEQLPIFLTSSKPAIFTSTNAAELVIRYIKESNIDVGDWNIYSLSGKTQEILKQYFTGKNIITANNASQLADKIISEKINEIVFYCGKIRRDELPDTLKKNNVHIHEVIVYETIETPSKIAAEPDGILFFSPSGVQSFFKVNQLSDKTLCFAIGETTANSLKQYTKNKIVQSQFPDPANMIKDVATYFKNQSEHGIKK